MEEKGKQFIENYVGKVLELQERSRKFSKKYFSEDIQDLHLSTREEAEIQREFNRLFQKGGAYYKAGSYEKAIEHLEIASHLDPFHLATHLILVDAYKHLYLKTHRRSYADKAIDYCKSGMNIQVYNPYFPKIETYMEEHLEASKRSKLLSYSGVLGTVGGVGLVIANLAKVLSLNILVGAVFAVLGLIAFVLGRSMQKTAEKKLKSTTISVVFA